MEEGQVKLGLVSLSDFVCVRTVYETWQSIDCEDVRLYTRLIIIKNIRVTYERHMVSCFVFAF
jgi:hypothetical protein